MSIARINSTYLRRFLVVAYAPVFVTIVTILIVLEGIALAVIDIFKSLREEAVICKPIVVGAWKGPVR